MSLRAATTETLKLDPSLTYVAWQSFSVTLDDGTSPVIPKGSRLRADDPAVLACPDNFVKDRASRAEVAEAAQAYRNLHPLPPPEPDLPPPAPPARDEDAAIAIRDVNSALGDRFSASQLEQVPRTVLTGERLPKDHPIVEANHSAFVPVVPGKLQREDALVATTTMLTISARPIEVVGVYGKGEDEYVIYAGTWVAREGNPFVTQHPTHFNAPAPG